MLLELDEMEVVWYLENIMRSWIQSRNVKRIYVNKVATQLNSCLGILRFAKINLFCFLFTIHFYLHVHFEIIKLNGTKLKVHKWSSPKRYMYLYKC